MFRDRAQCKTSALVLCHWPVASSKAFEPGTCLLFYDQTGHSPCLLGAFLIWPACAERGGDGYMDVIGTYSGMYRWFSVCNIECVTKPPQMTNLSKMGPGV